MHDDDECDDREGAVERGGYERAPPDQREEGS
jgi:hypothetical protein